MTGFIVLFSCSFNKVQVTFLTCWAYTSHSAVTNCALRLPVVSTSGEWYLLACCEGRGMGLLKKQAHECDCLGPESCDVGRCCEVAQGKGGKEFIPQRVVMAHERPCWPEKITRNVALRRSGQHLLGLRRASLRNDARNLVMWEKKWSGCEKVEYLRLSSKGRKDVIYFSLLFSFKCS